MEIKRNELRDQINGITSLENIMFNFNDDL